MPGPDAIETVLALEREMQSREGRADIGRMRELLSEEFVEVGASGRRWNREEVLDLMASEPHDSAVIQIESPEARMLSEDFVLVLWTSRRGERVAKRTSLWQRRGGDWRLTLHQGTPVGE